MAKSLLDAVHPEIERVCCDKGAIAVPRAS